MVPVVPGEPPASSSFLILADKCYCFSTYNSLRTFKIQKTARRFGARLREAEAEADDLC